MKIRQEGSCAVARETGVPFGIPHYNVERLFWEPRKTPQLVPQTHNQMQQPSKPEAKKQRSAWTFWLLLCLFFQKTSTNRTQNSNNIELQSCRKF
jgi:hypothetical protein